MARISLSLSPRKSERLFRFIHAPEWLINAYRPRGFSIRQEHEIGLGSRSHVLGVCKERYLAFHQTHKQKALKIYP